MLYAAFERAAAISLLKKEIEVTVYDKLGS